MKLHPLNLIQSNTLIKLNRLRTFHLSLKKIRLTPIWHLSLSKKLKILTNNIDFQNLKKLFNKSHIFMSLKN